MFNKIISVDLPVSLDRLRRFRGSDDAIKRISNPSQQALLLNFLKDPWMSSRTDLILSTMRNYSGEAYGDFQWRKVTGGWTTPEVPTIYGEFRSQFSALAGFSFDSGFVTHLPEFMSFIQAVNFDLQDVSVVRENFKNHLGYRDMWRGVMLTDEEYATTLQYGYLSDFPKLSSERDHLASQFEANVLSTRVDELIEVHFHGENNFSPFISITANKDIAIAVGRHFGNKRDGRKFYLLKLKVPEIDIIHYTDHAVRKPAKLQSLVSKLSVSVDSRASHHDWDRDAESYVYWKLDKKDIVDVSRPDVSETSWNGRKTIGKF